MKQGMHETPHKSTIRQGTEIASIHHRFVRAPASFVPPLFPLFALQCYGPGRVLASACIRLALLLNLSM